MLARRTILLLVLLTAFAIPAGAQTTLPPGGTFVDDDGNPHEGAIEAISAAGITAGCESERFCPSRPVTRAETAAFLVRPAVVPATTTGTFSRCPAESGTRDSWSGSPPSESPKATRTAPSGPLQPVSRGEMAVL